jgi:spermidine synthase
VRSPRAGQPRVFTRPTPRGIELRVDGTLASLFRPGHLRSGPVWDALAAPLVALPAARRRRILFLGFGGGSAARLARAMVPDAEMVGVERDPEVLRLARRDFGIDALGVEIVEGDVLDYLEREPRRFDAVVEDVLEGSVRRPHRTRTLLERYHLVHRRVARGGVLVVNSLHETPALTRLLRRSPQTLVRLDVKDHYNSILALGPRTLRSRELRARLRAHPLLSPSLPDWTLRTIRP